MEFIKNIGSKGEVVIPKILRENYKMSAGDELIVIAKEEGVLITKNKENPIKILEEIAEIALKKRKGKKFTYKKEEFYEQYEERARRAGLLEI